MASNAARLSLFALLALLLASCVGTSKFTSGDRAQIEERARLWADAVVAGDVGTIVSLYDPEAVLLPNGGAPIVGHEAIATYFSALPKVRGVSLHLVEVDGHGPLAYVFGTYRMKLTLPGTDDAIEQFGRYAEIWHRHRGGWLIARDLFHALDEAPPEFAVEATTDGAAAASSAADETR